jgi:primosomal replication protein N
MESNNIVCGNSSQLSTNSITISGTISTAFEFSHEVYGECFYSFYIDNKRLSNTSDVLPVIISERLLTTDTYSVGDRVTIIGQIRSYNNSDGVKTHLVLSIFVKSIYRLDDDTSDITNSVTLDGYICKKPIYRTTPFGREIADILLAVNRAYGKSDYIPAICWGRNAKFTSGLDVGCNIIISGRMQSRNYQKRLANGDSILKTAYEVSISKMEQKQQTF